MDNSFQTSFIPKKPTTPNSVGYSTTTKSDNISISMVISTFILIVVIVATAGFFFYRGYLQKSKDGLSADLFKMRSSFDDNTISVLESYDKKATIAKQVLGSHIVLSPLFEKLNKLTLSSIQYTKFSHSVDKDIFSVKISGISKDYKSIALQADVFNSSDGSMFKNVIFSNLTKDDKTSFVTFDLEFDVDKAFLSYANNNLINEAAIVKDATPAIITTAPPTITNTDNIVQDILPATTKTQ